MKEFLGKQYGPFKGREWLIVGVAGVGLGLIIRYAMGRRNAGNSDDPGVQEIIGTTQPAVVNGGTRYNQGAIVQDVIESLNPRFARLEKRLNESDPTSPGTTPTPGGSDRDRFLGNLDDEYSPGGANPLGVRTEQRISVKDEGPVQWPRDDRGLIPPPTNPGVI